MMRLITIACILNIVSVLRGQTVAIPDPDFLAHLKAAYPAAIDANNELIIAQAATYTGSFNCSNKNIHSLEGLQYFTNVTRLDASDNALTSCEQISTLSYVTKLNVSNNQITSLPSLQLLTDMEMLIVSRNKLAHLPDLSANTNLKEIIAYTNSLVDFPSVATLDKLEKIDLGNNLLTLTPDFSHNPGLKFLSIDRNFLTTIPDLSALDSLTEVQFHLNHFTFSDFIPVISYSGFSTNFTISPQRPIAHDSIRLISTDTLHLNTGADPEVPGISYTWFFKNSVLLQADDDSTIIFPASKPYEGYYYAVLSYPSIPGLQLRTDSFFVSITSCPSADDIAFEYEEINCLKSGKLKISLPGMPVEPYRFYLKPDAKEQEIISGTGIFEHLALPVYHLTIQLGTNCIVLYPQLIRIPLQDCEEAFITPDGDGDKDIFYFDQKGSVVIYDKDGKRISSFALPAEWDGSTDTGKKVPPGYYVCNINDGETVVRITVVY